jgi:hypothetical protein
LTPGTAACLDLIEDNIQINMRRCHPHMYGFMYGYGVEMPGKQKLCPTSAAMLFLGRAKYGAKERLY